MKRECGDRLRATRKALGFAHSKDLADILGCEPARYRTWERGDHFPPPEFLIALKRTYGIPADWLLDGELATLPRALAPKIFALLKRPRGGTGDTFQTRVSAAPMVGRRSRRASEWLTCSTMTNTGA